jgi:hypothetical protein
MRWAGHAAGMGNITGASMALVGKPDGKITLRIPKCRWEDNIKTDFQEVGWRCMDWIALAQDRAR